MAVKMPENEFKTLSEQAGIGLGEEINQMYLNFDGVNKLSLSQIIDAYVDIGKKLGGNFKVRQQHDRISVEIIESPFEKDNVQAMNNILAAVFAKISSLNLGYARAIVSESENHKDVIDVYLKREDKNQ